MALLGVVGHGGDTIPPHLAFPTGTAPFSEVSFGETGLITPALGQKVPSSVIFYEIQPHPYYFFF